MPHLHDLQDASHACGHQVLPTKPLIYPPCPSQSLRLPLVTYPSLQHLCDFQDAMACQRSPSASHPILIPPLSHSAFPTQSNQLFNNPRYSYARRKRFTCGENFNKKTAATIISNRESTVIIKNCYLKKCISKHLGIISLKTNPKLLSQKVYFKI